MKAHNARLAVGGAALAAVAALAACGSSSAGSPAPTAASTPRAASSQTAAAFSAADVAFTSGMIRLEGQAQALGALAAAHTSMAQLSQFADHLRGHETDARHMSDLMSQWRQPAPSPWTPGASIPPGMGPGMMDAHDWAQMQHRYGHDFNDHWLDAMIQNRNGELALCRAELRSGTSPQARRLAHAMLSERQAQLTQLQRWHHAWDHANHSGS